MYKRQRGVGAEPSSTAYVQLNQFDVFVIERSLRFFGWPPVVLVGRILLVFFGVLVFVTPEKFLSRFLLPA